ncbi:MAG: tRNA pseudouridine(38-40) synthase TruA [Myxococcales bacterium]|nr:tRNA pseudouridine(38-40) synthase TruA [Myxococcales bacterium]
MSVLLRLAYDGAEFHGFARQAAGERGPVRTVQGELEEALAVLYKAPVTTRGASRTDAGVHARGQLVAFDPPFAIPTRGLLLGLSGLLPRDLTVVAAWTEERQGGAPVDPRFENLGKRYRYRLRCARLRDPWTERFEWQLSSVLDHTVMQAAARAFVGEHDFGSFRASACQARTTVRRIRSVTVTRAPIVDAWPSDPGSLASPDDAILTIEVDGLAFLYNMVRIMVGTLVEVGRGRRAPGSIAELLANPDRARAGATAPARGLTLDEVLWPSSAQGRR